MKENYADVLESYIIKPAQEGFGLDLLKLMGKGVVKVAKGLGIFIGLNIAFVGLIIGSNELSYNKHKKRYDNPTPEEKLSRDNFNETWVPEIEKFKTQVEKDINEADKKYDIKKFIDVCKSVKKTDEMPAGYRYYNYYLCWLKWEACQYPDADGDDEGNPELVKEFSEKISQMKPYFEKWKSEAKKFAPYFDLVIEVEDPDKDYYFCNFDIVLRCKWVDKDSILKPGLPKFNEK